MEALRASSRKVGILSDTSPVTPIMVVVGNGMVISAAKRHQ
jgi:hypothetical protein